ncbi:phospholipid/glycerol acyltransferase [gamma proteobacterium HTCC5015]|nr:phospholipid/glycerol acyltransferase [gamma proteobacterium HTCC5015]
MFTVDELLDNHYPSLQRRPLIGPAARMALRHLLHEKDFVDFAKTHPHLRSFEFIEEVLSYFNFSYTVKHQQRENIPPTGRLVMISNHPLGSLDALALLHLVGEIRRDVRIVANQMLMQLNPLHDLLLPVDNMRGNTPEGQLNAIEQHLDSDGAVIIFPAGEVSRLGPRGVADGRWHTGFLRMAQNTHSPVLPIHADARNSALFYGTATLSSTAATALLVREMFKQTGRQIRFTVGERIPFHAYADMPLSLREKTLLFKRHLYRVGRDKSGVFATECGIALPEPKSDLKRELEACEQIGETADGKAIYLYQHHGPSTIMREIGRLREVAFRAVGEGSGKRRDIDRYDQYYRHLVLWDRDELEIVGAYRLMPTQEAVEQHGLSGLYSASLFHFDEQMQPYLEQGLELGRSFVQPRYWGKRSLDYLWYGIGAYLSRHPDIRYLFGPVSITQNMPEMGKDLLVYFYQLYFAPESKSPARHRQPFQVPESSRLELEALFDGQDYAADFKRLKAVMSNMGTAVPTLYKQYTELCQPGGVSFLDFGIDPEFADCIDGLVLVDSHAIKPKKYKRYIGSHSDS